MLTVCKEFCACRMGTRHMLGHLQWEAWEKKAVGMFKK